MDGAYINVYGDGFDFNKGFPLLWVGGFFLAVMVRQQKLWLFILPVFGNDSGLR